MTKVGELLGRRMNWKGVLSMGTTRRSRMAGSEDLVS